ncbi:Carbon monoxide dehydrogenase subunit G [Klenkia marina]|uniref:Carbon monoxide dehydrogenase subunit G n=1 Tax=Klenkia marina TaxID=1960309 RepID=A0A1G4XRP4_9ACTN|nr:SRPBCC family protein [Klenkia marina]SCX43827.1 Carbon monoxide dehydrogenase subunit G [Klenkia marina]
MQLENSFLVPVPVDDAWKVLLDIERIAPCMPGAALDSVDGDDFTGRVKVKLGPINLTYAGKASFIEKDEENHKAVIDARGKDQRGNGTAAAVVTAVLKSEGDSTRVDVLTDLNITGRPAQFGRGVMTDVGNKLLGQFADKLAAQLGEPEAPAQEPTVEGTVKEKAAGAAATAAGAVGEVAESVAASTDGDTPIGDAVRKAGEATAQAADAAADKAAAVRTEAKKAPSKPPSGTTGPANKPGSSGPAASRPRPVQAEPEPIDLLDVAGTAAFTRFAKPAAIGVGALVLVALLVRRRR